MRSVVVFVLAAWAAAAHAGQDQAYEAARALTGVGATEAAITEYKRYMFFNPDSPAISVHLAIADLFRSEGKPEEAREAMLAAISCAPTDSMREEIRIQTALLAAAQGKFTTAQMELLRIASFTTIPAVRNRAELFLCIGDIFSGQWDAAQKIASAEAKSGNLRMARLDSLLRSAQPWRRKSPSAAQWMSTALPGLGQVYAGDVRDGVNALAISCVTGYFTVNSIIFGYYQEALLSETALFWRYYSGNRWNAAEAAERYNRKKNREMREKVMTLFSLGRSASQETGVENTRGIK
jgi:tetratricopeptide (TPR) repeat protein